MAIDEDEYRIEQYDTFTVAGVAERGTDIDAKALWADLAEFGDDLHDVAVSNEKYGVFFKFDQGDEEVTYLVGHAVDSTADLPPQLTAVEIPEGDYAALSLDDVNYDQIHPSLIEELLDDTDHEMQGEVVFHRDTSTGQSLDFDIPSEWFVPVNNQ